MKKKDEKKKKKELDPEIVERFMDDTWNALQALNERLSKERRTTNE